MRFDTDLLLSHHLEYGMILADAFLATRLTLLILIAGCNQLLSNITLDAVQG